MPRRHSVLVAVLAVGCTAAATLAQTHSPNLGKAPTEKEIKAWDLAIGPEGKELPAGSGNATTGAALYAQRGCARCHGPNLTEGPAPKLLGTDIRGGRYPVGVWPFAPLVWNYINQAMPYDRPGFLSNDEIYSLTAYLLFRNEAIQEGDVMDAKSLAQVRMPKRDQYLAAPEDWKPGVPRPSMTKP